MALQHAFADYADALLRRYDIGDVLYRLTDHVVDVLQIDGAGVSLRLSGDDLQFVSATDERVSRIEAAQIETRNGPCYEAYRSGHVVTVADLEQEQRWPAYRRVAEEQQFRAIAGIPMPLDHERIGALNLYATAPRDWSDDEIDVAQLLANVASGYIIHARSLEQQTTLSRQLQGALDSRVVIEQAKGVLAGKHDIDVDEAFARLRKHSRDTHTKIHDVARQVIAGQLDL